MGIRVGEDSVEILSVVEGLKFQDDGHGLDLTAIFNKEYDNFISEHFFSFFFHDDGCVATIHMLHKTTSKIT